MALRKARERKPRDLGKRLQEDSHSQSRSERDAERLRIKFKKANGDIISPFATKKGKR